MMLLTQKFTGNQQTQTFTFSAFAFFITVEENNS